MQDFLLYWLGERLIRVGPGLLFALCLLETAVFVGLVIPVGALIGVAALLSARGVFEFSEVVLAATTGAVVGDQIGFAVGRWFVPSGRPARGTISGLWQGALRRTESLVRRRGIVGVSAARAIPFVRTIMPWFAGRSGMRWGRFLVFDLLGIAVWAAVYLGGGFAAGYGWRTGADRFGEVAGGALVAVAAIGLLLAVQLWARRLLRRRRRSAGTEVADEPSAPLLDEEVLEALEARLRTLHPDSARRWGTMSVEQAISHLTESFRWRVEGRRLPRRGNLFHRTVLRWWFFHTSLPWPRGAPRGAAPKRARVQGGQAATGSDPAFAGLVKELGVQLRAFSALGDAMDGRAHPLFGRLSRREWARWAVRHLDHHLRQFGA